VYSFIFVFALQAFFPLFGSNSGEFTGLSVVNPDSKVQGYSVSVTTENGGTTRTGRLTLPANGQRAQLINEIVGDPVATPGWIRVDTEASAPVLFLASGNSEALDGAEAALSLSTSILLPYVEINTGFAELNYTDTLIAIVNPNTDSAPTTAQLFGLDGKLNGEATIPVPANGSRTFRISEVFQSTLPSNGIGGRVFQGYLRLNSPKPVAAWQRMETPLSRSVLLGTSPEDRPATTDAVLPHFAFGSIYRSIINVVNTASTPVTLDLAAFDDRGTIIGQTIQLTLAPGEGRRASTGELFRVPVIQIFPPPLISGYIRIRESQGRPFQVAGNIELFTLNSGGKQSALLSPIASQAAMNWLVPFSTSASPYYTGYAVVNANELLTAQTDVTVEVIGSDGTVRSQTNTSLSPRQRMTGIIPPNIPSGYLRIRSNLPIYAMGSLGTSDERRMDQVPALH